MKIQLSNLTLTPNFRKNKKQIQNRSLGHSTLEDSFKHSNTQSYKTNFVGRTTAIEAIPLHIKNSREGLINEAINFITSKDFYENKINGKNWKDPEYVREMIALSKNPQALRKRVDLLLSKTQKKLGNIYKGKTTIVIPWSGGRDSSTLLCNSLVFYPNKNYVLLTALNGMTKEFENPIIQYKRLLARLNNPQINIQHKYIDCVDDIKEHAVNSALYDKTVLGSPALCSSCKIIMEKALGNVAKQYGSSDIILGYTKYQGLQDWVEQTPEQIKFLSEKLAAEGFHSFSPLYDILEYPFDPILSLSSLGIPLKEHKIEMKCSAGGLNPKNLNKEKLLTFLEYKNLQTNHIFSNIQKTMQGTLTDKERFQSLIPDVKTLRTNKLYRKGIFEEKKYNGT